METWASRNWDEDKVSILHGGDFDHEVRITAPVQKDESHFIDGGKQWKTEFVDKVKFLDERGYPIDCKNTYLDMNDVEMIEVSIPAEVLRDFVLNLLRHGMLNRLEEMTPDELADYFAKR